MTDQPPANLDWDMPNPFAISLTVQPNNIDNYGHVNNAVYVGWLDSCAWEHSVHVGIGKQTCDDLGKGMVVRKTQIEYVRPCFDGEKVWVGNWLVFADGRLRANRRFQIIREADGATLVRALLHYVCVDLEGGKPTRWPPVFTESYTVLPEIAEIVSDDGYRFQPGVDRF